MSCRFYLCYCPHRSEVANHIAPWLVCLLGLDPSRSRIRPCPPHVFSVLASSRPSTTVSGDHLGLPCTSPTPGCARRLPLLALAIGASRGPMSIDPVAQTPMPAASISVSARILPFPLASSTFRSKPGVENKGWRSTALTTRAITVSRSH